MVKFTMPAIYILLNTVEIVPRGNFTKEAKEAFLIYRTKEQ